MIYSQDEIDAETRAVTAKLTPETLSKEPTTCWPDYADITPVERLWPFAEAYVSAYQLYYQRRTSVRSAPYVDPLGRKKKGGMQLSSMTKTKLNHLMLGRQAADSFSMPYPQYCSFAVRVGDEHFWPYLPQVFQIHSTAMRALVNDSWEKHIKHHLVLPEKRTQSESFYAYVKRLAQLRTHPQLLAKHLIDKQYLSIDSAREIFGFDLAGH